MSVHRRFPSDFFISSKLRVASAVRTQKHQIRPPRLIVRNKTKESPIPRSTPKFGTPQPPRGGK